MHIRAAQIGSRWENRRAGERALRYIFRWVLATPQSGIALTPLAAPSKPRRGGRTTEPVAQGPPSDPAAIQAALVVSRRKIGEAFRGREHHLSSLRKNRRAGERALRYIFRWVLAAPQNRAALMRLAAPPQPGGAGKAARLGSEPCATFSRGFLPRREPRKQ